MTSALAADLGRQVLAEPLLGHGLERSVRMHGVEDLVHLGHHGRRVGAAFVEGDSERLIEDRIADLYDREALLDGPLDRG